MMNDAARMEEAARAAMRAIAGTVTGAPPLRLPPAPASPAPVRRRWRARGWIIPLTAAAAVIAIAGGLAALHRADNGPAPWVGRPASPAKPGQVPRAAGSPACGGRGVAASAAAPAVPADVPRYFVEQCLGPIVGQSTMGPIRAPGRLVAAETRTGAILGSVPPPSGDNGLTGIYGTAGNRVFVVSAYDGAPGAPRTALWLLRLAPGTARPVTLTRLRWTLTDATSLAVSPDGTKIAASFRVLSKGKPVDRTPVRIYSLAAGAVLRAWVTSGAVDALQWTGDGRGLAYELSGSAFAVHDIAAPGSDLTAGSTVLLSLPASNPAETLNTACGGPQSGWAVSANGTTIICPANSQGARSAGSPWERPVPGTGRCPAGSPQAQLAFPRFAAGAQLPGTPPAGTDYSVTTCASDADFVRLQWACADGTEVIGQLAYPGHNEVGVFYAGSYVPLPAIGGAGLPLAF